MHAIAIWRGLQGAAGFWEIEVYAIGARIEIPKEATKLDARQETPLITVKLKAHELLTKHGLTVPLHSIAIDTDVDATSHFGGCLCPACRLKRG